MKGPYERTLGFLLVAPTLALTGAAGCAPSDEQTKAASELAPFTLDRLPEDVQHRTFIDFGSKMQILGYEVTPEGRAGPGQSVQLKIFWKAAGPLSTKNGGKGWRFFTHLEGDGGRMLANLDQEGPFRSWLSGNAPASLALLEVGKIYVDEQTFDMPKAEGLAPEVSIAVGVCNPIELEPYRDVRLPVVSGPTNGHDAGIITRFSTGLQRPKLARAPQAARP